MRQTSDGLGGKLTDIINTAVGAKLADTDAGSAWVMKAINPSWPGSCYGMPDKTSSTTVMYNFDQEYSVESPVLSADAWNAEFNFHAHPIATFDFIHSLQSSPNDISGSKTFLNTQLPENPNPPAATGVRWTDTVAQTTANYLYKTEEWKKMCQQARLCYFGATVVQTGSSNNDQGFLKAGQQPQAPVRTQIIDTVNGQIIAQDFYAEDDFGKFDNFTGLGRTYSGQSRDGGYSVMKLDEEYTQFKSQVTPVSIQSTTVGTTTGTNGSVPSPHMFIAITNGTRGIELMSHYQPQIIIKGVAPGTSFTVRVRMGIEVRPFAGSSNTPFARESPKYDVLSLEMYSALMLSVQQDGYPADYNLFEWLGKAIRKVAPYLVSAAKGAIGNVSGGIPGMISGALGGVAEQISGGNEGKRRRTREVEFYPED